MKKIRFKVFYFVMLFGISSMSACNKEADSPVTNKVKKIPKDEIERARKACLAYAKRLCTCAETHPELSEDCQLWRSQPQALELNLELSQATGLDDTEAKAVKVETRKIAAACFQADNKLDPVKCPRSP